MPTTDRPSLESNPRGCEQATSHLGHHMSRFLNRIESQLVRPRADTGIRERLHHSTEVSLLMRLVNLVSHRLMLRPCRLSIAQSLLHSMRLRFKTDNDLPSSRNSNDSSLCMVDRLKMGNINPKSHRQEGQWKNRNKCSSNAASWAYKRSTEKAVSLHYLKLFKERKGNKVVQLMNPESKANLVGCSRGSEAELVVLWVFPAQSVQDLKQCHFQTPARCVEMTWTKIRRLRMVEAFHPLHLEEGGDES